MATNRGEGKILYSNLLRYTWKIDLSSHSTCVITREDDIKIQQK